jgi:hypothetical protein
VPRACIANDDLKISIGLQSYVHSAWQLKCQCLPSYGKNETRGNDNVLRTLMCTMGPGAGRHDELKAACTAQCTSPPSTLSAARRTLFTSLSQQTPTCGPPRSVPRHPLRAPREPKLQAHEHKETRHFGSKLCRRTRCRRRRE